MTGSLLSSLTIDNLITQTNTNVFRHVREYQFGNIGKLVVSKLEIS